MLRAFLHTKTFKGLCIFAAVILGYIIWLLCFYTTPLAIKSITVLSPQTTGVVSTYNVVYCRYNTNPATVHRELIGVNGTKGIYKFPVLGGVGVPRCGTATVPFPVPASLSPGSYKLEINSTFQVNKLKAVHVIAYSNVFKVVKS